MQEQKLCLENGAEWMQELENQNENECEGKSYYQEKNINIEVGNK